MTRIDRDLGVTIDVRRDVTMWHTVLCIGADGEACAVAITNDPTRHAHRAQVVMHKTRSVACAKQVARYVRRRFGVEAPAEVLRAPRPVEAMIGYALVGGVQHPPSVYREEIYDVVRHVAATSIARLLEEVAGGHNAARTRYTVYEVRAGAYRARGVTNKFTALERRYREAPPDTLPSPCEIVRISTHADAAEARAQILTLAQAGDHLWTRKPPADYVRRILRVEHGEIVWACDGSSAVRAYDFPAVVIGPHVYTEAQVRGVLERGAWSDGRRR